MAKSATERPHVMRVYSRLEVGGIEKQMLRLLPRLNAERYRVSLCLLKRAGELVDELRGLGVVVHVLPFKGRLHPGSLLELARLFRRERVAIVHSHVRESNTSATVAARLARVPVVIGSIHNMNTIHGRRRVLQDRLLDRWRDAVVTVSNSVRDDYCRTVGISPRKCVTIYNGLDLEEFTASEAGGEVSGVAGSAVRGSRNPGIVRNAMRSALGLSPVDRVVITVARLVRQKAHEVLIDAANRVVPAVESVRFLIVGDGPRREELEALARERGLGERFRFLGGRSDVRDLYRASDVSCLTSTREGFSNVIVESLASGLPVVATDVGGNCEAIEEGVSGFLKPSGDAAGIASRLVEVLSDETLRARMSAAARARASRFSLEETVRATESLYDRLLAAKRRRA